MFEIAENAWHRGPDMPTWRFGHGIAVVSGRVFVIGGITREGISKSVTAFSIEKNEWEEIPPMSMNRSRPGVGVVSDKIFVMGGHNGREITNTCEAFDVEENRWEHITPMKSKRNNMGVAVIGDHIIVIGGRNSDSGTLRTVEELDTKTNTWTMLSPMSIARSGMAIAVIDDHIWTFGGFDGNRIHDLIEEFDIWKNTWMRSDIVMTSPRFSAKAVVVDDKVFIIGGTADSYNAVEEVEVFDWRRKTWEKAPPMSVPRVFHATIGI